jgi:hypothetical protein
MLIRNLRYAIRSLARAPGFTLTVVLTLAIGTGANSAVFSALNAVLLRPLPLPDSGRLVKLSDRFLPFAGSVAHRSDGSVAGGVS